MMKCFFGLNNIYFQVVGLCQIFWVQHFKSGHCTDSFKSQIVTLWGFVHHTVSIAITQLCHLSAKAAINISELM